MNWFHQLCRNMGLMVHNIKHPDAATNRQVSRKVEEKKIDETTTLRRTTIEEIEIKRDAGRDAGERDAK